MKMVRQPYKSQFESSVKEKPNSSQNECMCLDLNNGIMLESGYVRLKAKAEEKKDENKFLFSMWMNPATFLDPFLCSSSSAMPISNQQAGLSLNNKG